MITFPKNLGFCVAFLSLTVFTISPVHAQKNDPPSGQFGVGVYSIRSSTPSGLEAVYAINQNIQVGSELSLSVTSSGGASVTTILFGPFARYLIPTTVSPFIQGGLQVLSTGSTSNTGVFLGAGVAYNINHEIALHAGVDILNVYFSPSSTTFGWSFIPADADWFF